jgi:hypothetical protein
MDKHKPYRQIFCMAFIMMIYGNSFAQRINFGVWAGSSTISVRSVSGNSDLVFGNMFIGSVKTIQLNSNDAAAFDITAAGDYEITVSVNASDKLTGPDGKTIPLKLKFAYSNQGAVNISLAKAGAIEVPDGFGSVTFPIRKNVSGLPAPPPVPLDGTNNKRIIERAYLFIYGSAGPAATDANAGEYTGNVSITVEYNQ